MSARTEKLLTLYKAYENLVRNEGQDPRSLEDSMDETAASRARMIRNFRNYLSHQHDPGFLEPTDKMLDVLTDMVNDWALKGDVVRQHVKTPAAAVCDVKDTCAAGIVKLAKLKRTKLVVTTSHGEYTIYDVFALAEGVAKSKTTKISGIKPLRERPVFVTPTTKFEDIDDSRVNICTSDGTPAGKLVGVVMTSASRGGSR